ncbi:MAG: hypothetical protein P8X90_29005 [Desulfobacterales bacterium]
MANNHPSYWPGPRLLVPIMVEALVVSSAARNAAWSRLQMNYENLHRFQLVAPQPNFEETTQHPPPTGVTLHWALPDGLTHGVVENGAVDYPILPNRWVVLRMHPAAAKRLPSSRIRHTRPGQSLCLPGRSRQEQQLSDWLVL